MELPAELQKVIKNQYGDNPPPLVVERDKIIINDHVINSNDPTIIDVLSKHEQGHLFGKHDGRPMAIEIVAGLPMQYPKQVSLKAVQNHCRLWSHIKVSGKTRET